MTDEAKKREADEARKRQAATQATDASSFFNNLLGDQLTVLPE